MKIIKDFLQCAGFSEGKIRTSREIIHVAAELAPLAKVGGLGDVIHGLCRALLKKNHNVKVILPKYDTLDLNWVEDLKVIHHSTLLFDGRVCAHTFWQGTVDEIPVVFIESNDPQGAFDRGTIYGCPDDIGRFCYFCLTALAYIKTFPCDVIHIHDWHTALLAGLIKEQHPEIESTIVFTIHNLLYQGLCRAEDLEKVGWKSPLLKESGVYNLLKGGIIFADFVTTVSPTYAKEILNSELGGNLQTTLQQNSKKFSGILNGIDYSFWNPETDSFLPYPYSIHSLTNKEKIKNDVKKRFSLAEERSPLVVVITRLVPQKGPELIKAALLHTLEMGGQFILLGSAVDDKTHIQFFNLKKRLTGCAHIHLELSYSEELAHLLYAAADLLLIPSIFEPCGLSQMIAMRYGAVPLARTTGGLADTVFEGKNGFTFGPPTAEAIHGALDRALDTWHHKPEVWHQLVEAGMQGNYSWEKPAEEYVHLYSSVDFFRN